ncbi:MAG: WecB/TagA/CpsF family glycosyltransferase [Nodosilinea sp. LVE1205-7]|jgi:N-acetylglucosaminyldiphosphoundecaprenol N-acetyl-beta-D-mannosaminyltransferase
MEPEVSNTPCFDSAESTGNNNCYSPILSSDSQDIFLPKHLAVSKKLTATDSQTVSAEVKANLYQRFRKAKLESKARILQQQGQSFLSTAIQTAQPLSFIKFGPDNSNPNSFDPYLNTIPQVEFLGFRFHRLTQSRALETLLSLTQSDKSYKVYFANAHSIEVAAHNSDFLLALKRSNLLFADGSGILVGSKLVGKPLTYNLNGTDLIPALFEATSHTSETLSVYFLGARPGVARQAATNALAKYPKLHVAGIQDGYFDNADLSLVLSRIRAAKPDILLVAMGTPLQEIWIDRYSSQLPGVVCIGVGGLLDFMAERVPRAPKMVRYLGSEWIWRLLIEPRRLWRRYTIGNLVYLWVLITFTVKQLFLQSSINKTTKAQ